MTPIDIRTIRPDATLDYERTGRTSYDDDCISVAIFSILFLNQMADTVATDLATKVAKSRDWRWIGDGARAAARRVLTASSSYNRFVADAFGWRDPKARDNGRRLICFADMIDRLDEEFTPQERFGIFDQTKYAIRICLERSGAKSHAEEMAEVYFAHGMTWMAYRHGRAVLSAMRSVGRGQIRYASWLVKPNMLWMLRDLMRSTQHLHQSVRLSRQADVRRGFRIIYQRMLDLRLMGSAIGAGCDDAPAITQEQGSAATIFGISVPSV